MKVTVRISFFLTALILTALGLYPPRVLAAENTEIPLKRPGIIENLGQQIDLSLLFHDEQGQEHSLEELFRGDIPVIITPVYYRCPRLCSLNLNGLLEGINTLDLSLSKDYKVVSVSFDSSEGPELARAKAKSYYAQFQNPSEAKAGWRFLTGNQENLMQFMQQLGFQYEQDGADFSHAAGIMVLTPAGVISRYLYGISYPTRDLRLALLEASQGKIGNTLDRVLLYCFRFDPLQGKYSLAIMNVVRIVCSAAALCLFTLLGYLHLKEKKAKNRA